MLNNLVAAANKAYELCDGCDTIKQASENFVPAVLCRRLKPAQMGRNELIGTTKVVP